MTCECGKPITNGLEEYGDCIDCLNGQEGERMHPISAPPRWLVWVVRMFGGK